MAKGKRPLYPPRSQALRKIPFWTRRFGHPKRRLVGALSHSLDRGQLISHYNMEETVSVGEAKIQGTLEPWQRCAVAAGSFVNSKLKLFG
jgi:hypothetical protein